MSESIESSINHRREHRISNVYPVFVRATCADGRRIKASTLTDNISPGGLFMQLPYLLTHGAQLFAFISVPGSARLAAIGRVVRSENKNHGLTGFAVCFTQTRLLPLQI